MDCKYSYKDIVKLTENSLSIRDSEELKMHLNDCKKCKCYYESLEIANKFILDEVPLKHGFHDSIMTQIDKSRYLNKKYSILQLMNKLIPAIKYTSATLVFCLILVALILNIPNIKKYTNNDSIGMSSSVTNTVNPNTTTSPYTINESILLEFKNVDTMQSVEVIERNVIKEIYIEKDVSNGKAFIFANSNDEEYLHGGIKINDTYYDLGKVSMNLNEQEMETISIKEVNLGNLKLLRIFGIMGANFGQTSYYSLYDVKPSTFLTINGDGIESDIDNDGNKEIISSSGTSAYTYLYKYEDGYIKESNINVELNAEAVLFDENTNIFSAYYNDEKIKSKLFTYNGKEMVLLNIVLTQKH